MTAFSDLIASLDADPAKRGKQFEIFVKWFLKTDPEWATQVDQVWLWEEYPDRWGIDCGIDLVFRHKNGEIWSVQAKCYASSYDITKHDVDKFLSESNRRCIDKRLLIATTNRIGANAKQVCDAQEKMVVRYLLSSFECADIEYPATLAEIHTGKPKDKPRPREHQVEAITAVANGFQFADRGQLIMACGTGKTFTTLWIKESLASNLTLVLVPSLGLLSQTLHEWTLAANQSFEVLCVCSDDTVGKRGADEAIHSVADLAFPVTSDMGEIRNFLKRDGARVVFSTYQSSPLVAQAQEDAPIQAFELVIADEAHRCAGKVGSDFSTVLDSIRIRAKKRLFTTATHRTYSTSVKKVAGERGIEVVGMDDEAVFGKVLYALPFGEAIKRGLLTDYQVVIIGVDNPTIAAWIENRELLKTDTGIENDAESLAAQIGLLKAFKDYDLQRVISFHSRVNRAESFTTDMQRVVQWIGQDHRPSGTLKTDFVSGAMPTDKRRRKLAQLKSMAPLERGLLANARCLSEGVDVPSLDGVAFIDPRSSQIDIIQAVGRAIRLSPNKKTGTIVLPVFIEDGDTPIESIEASNFKPIWDVLNALKAHDDVLSAEMDQLRTEMGRRTDSVDGGFGKITIDLPATVDSTFSGALHTYLVEQVTATWDFYFGLLLYFMEQHGHCRVHPTYITDDGYNLGNWVTVQRSRCDRLTTDRRRRLETLPGWSFSPFDDQWNEGIERIVAFADAHGTGNVPARYITDDGFNLGNWVSNKRLKTELLSDDRKLQLERIPGWTWDVNYEKWHSAFAQLKAFSELRGHCVPPINMKSSEGVSLSSWIKTQRQNRKILNADSVGSLEQLPGWSWDPRQDSWTSSYASLSHFVKRNGHALVDRTFVDEDGFRLGDWVKRQRGQKDKLDGRYVALLERLPRWSWGLISDNWEQGFSCLSEFLVVHQNCKMDQHHIFNGFPLGRWVSKQREAKDKMDADRRVRLGSLKGWTWDPFADQWEEGFTHLNEYCEMHGSAAVSQSLMLPNGFRLGGWVSRQRQNRGKLGPDRMSRLESLPGWTWRLR